MTVLIQDALEEKLAVVEEQAKRETAPKLPMPKHFVPSAPRAPASPSELERARVEAEHETAEAAKPKAEPPSDIERFVSYVRKAADEKDLAVRVERVLEMVNDSCATRFEAKTVAARLDIRIREIAQELAAHGEDPFFGAEIDGDDDDGK